MKPPPRVPTSAVAEVQALLHELDPRGLAAMHSDAYLLAREALRLAAEVDQLRAELL